MRRCWVSVAEAGEAVGLLFALFRTALYQTAEAWPLHSPSDMSPQRGAILCIMQVPVRATQGAVPDPSVPPKHRCARANLPRRAGHATKGTTSSNCCCTTCAPCRSVAWPEWELLKHTPIACLTTFAHAPWQLQHTRASLAAVHAPAQVPAWQLCMPQLGWQPAQVWYASAQKN